MREPEELSEFEQQLKQAMRRVDARKETVAKFYAIAAEVDRERALPWRQRQHRWAFRLPKVPVWAFGAVAATLVAAVGVDRVQHERQRENATRQFEVASHIEEQAMQHAREKLSQAGISLEP